MNDREQELHDELCDLYDYHINWANEYMCAMMNLENGRLTDSEITDWEIEVKE